MKKTIAIIGAGMGGLAAGIHGQRNGFQTAIFEAHDRPGGQCTSWTRKGYVFDACIHHFNGFSPEFGFNPVWNELGALKCEIVPLKECVSVMSPDGTRFNDYYDLEKLEAHMKELAPADGATIDEYVGGIRSFMKGDPFGSMLSGSPLKKLVYAPYFLKRLKYLRQTLDTFAHRFTHPFLRKAFPLLNYSLSGIPLFFHMAKHAAGAQGDMGWPRGGSATLSANMAARYASLGGVIRYRSRVVRILTKNDRACGVELENGEQHRADFVVSNADGRKTVMDLLEGRYVNKKIGGYCRPAPDAERPFAVLVFLGVKRDLSAQPSSLLMFLDEPAVVAGRACDHLDLQVYGFDASLAPAGKGVIKVELFSRPSYFARLHDDREAYRAEKKRIADQVIALLEKRFPGLREDVEAIDVATLHTWERFMGGSGGFDNFPAKNGNLSYVLTMLGLNRQDTLPGLRNFLFAGGWVTSAGALFLNALSGKTAVRKICRQCGMKFERAGEAG